MPNLYPIPAAEWHLLFPAATRQGAQQALEQGMVLHFSSLPFPISQSERRFLDPGILARSKNVGYNPATGQLGGTGCQGQDAADLKGLLKRYADLTLSLFQRLLLYGPALRRERTSLRPVAIESRVSSWRKDDKLLHVDSFPSAPVQGRRILRLFCNVNPHGQPRRWRVGEPFPQVAQRFWPRLSAPGPIRRRLLSLLRITKGLRSEYDDYMLQLHDAMKRDADYQREAKQERIDFQPGSAWACFTDQVSHAALAGQHQLEQTFTLPVDALQRPDTSPLRVLERLAARPLIARTDRAAA